MQKKFDQNISILTWSKSIINRVIRSENNCILFDKKQIELIENLDNKIEEIEIELKTNLHDQFTMANLEITSSFFHCDKAHENTERICSINSVVFLRTGQINVILVGTTVMKRLHLANGVTCNNIYHGLKGENINDQKIFKCIEHQTNESFKCLPIHNYGLIKLGHHSNFSDYNLCSTFKSEDTKRYKEILKTCINSVDLNCETNIYEAHTSFHDHSTNKDPEYTKIIILPKNSLITEYEQKYRMDWFEWLYNFGGTVGMWFGWSALSVAELMLLLKQNVSKIYKFITLMTMHLISCIIKMFPLNSISNRRNICFN